MKTTTLRPLKLKADGRIIPAGTACTVEFSTTPDERRVPFMNVTLPDGTVLKSARWTAYFKAPSMRTLEKWTMDSVCKSVTGGRCEPDGYSSDGAPSWLLALGMI